MVLLLGPRKCLRPREVGRGHRSRAVKNTAWPQPWGAGTDGSCPGWETQPGAEGQEQNFTTAPIRAALALPDEEE